MDNIIGFITNGYELTEEDYEEIQHLNAENGWGFSEDDCKDFLFNHMMCYIDILANADNKSLTAMPRYNIACIEAQLEDANYHALTKFLNEHDYDSARAWITEEYMED